MNTHQTRFLLCIQYLKIFTNKFNTRWNYNAIKFCALFESTFFDFLKFWIILNFFNFLIDEDEKEFQNLFGNQLVRVFCISRIKLGIVTSSTFMLQKTRTSNSSFSSELLSMMNLSSYFWYLIFLGLRSNIPFPSATRYRVRWYQ